VRLIFQGVLDPRPWRIPAERQASVTHGALRMGQGLGREPKEVLQKGFFRPPGRVVFHLVFPHEISVSLKRPAGQTPSHIKFRTRAEPEWRESRSAYTKEEVSLDARELLLRHFVDKSLLERRSEGKRLLALTPSFPRFLEVWGRMGASLELQLPPLVYDPKTGEAIKGGPLPADIALLLAPEEVAWKVLQELHAALEVSARIVQWVKPSTLLERPHVHELAYNLARKAGGIPFLLEGLTHNVLGIVHTRDGFFWKLLSPEGRLTPFYANAFVLGHQWKRVCRLRVSGSWARTRHRSATTSIISSRSRKVPIGHRLVHQGPHPLHGLELGRVGRQEDQAHPLRHLHPPGLGPHPGVGQEAVEGFGLVKGVLEVRGQGGHHLAYPGGARGQDAPAHLLQTPEGPPIGGKGRRSGP